MYNTTKKKRECVDFSINDGEQHNFCDIPSEKYVCETCNFVTNKKTNYMIHMETKKHMNKISGIRKIHKCNHCQKCFNNRSTMWYHNKKCIENIMETLPIKQEESTDNTITLDKEIIRSIMTQSQDFKSLLIDQLKREHEDRKDLKNLFVENTNKMVEIAKSINTNHHNTTNSHNTTNHNKFNLNFFLNEQCKNAINMSEFIDSVQVELEDVTNVGKNGFVHGITDVIMRHLNQLDIFNRPIHCTDLKREILHIREENQWNKETDHKTIKKCVDKIAHKNCKKIVLWQDIFKESKILDSPTYHLWLEIIGQSMNTGDKGERNTEKVIKNIAKNVFLEKSGGSAGPE
jgi:hypothetical protein